MLSLHIALYQTVRQNENRKTKCDNQFQNEQINNAEITLDFDRQLKFFRPVSVDSIQI